MKKCSFFFAFLCLCLVGCGRELGSRPVTVPAASSGSSPSNAVYEAGQQALLDWANRTPGGVYYEELPPPENPFPLSQQAISTEEAAERAAGLAASLGFPVTDLLWQVSAVPYDPDSPTVARSCFAVLPPVVDSTVDYAQATVEDLSPREFTPAIEINLGEDGRVLSYYCHQPSPFELGQHTAEEQQTYLEKQQEWLGSEEFQQIVLEGAKVLGPAPVKQLLPPEGDAGEWRVELENGDVYSLELSLGVSILERFALLY